MKIKKRRQKFGPPRNQPSPLSAINIEARIIVENDCHDGRPLRLFLGAGLQQIM